MASDHTLSDLIKRHAVRVADPGHYHALHAEAWIKTHADLVVAWGQLRKMVLISRAHSYIIDPRPHVSTGRNQRSSFHHWL